MWDFNLFSNNTAVITEDGKKIAYTELLKMTGLLAEKIGKRCLVFVLCENKIGSIIGYSAFLNGRIVPLMLDAHLDRALLGDITNNYKPDYYWVPSDVLPEFPQFSPVFDLCGYTLLKTPYNSEYPLNDELALLLTTSGSTGSPKFVRQSYENISANTEAIAQYLQLDESERPITTLPMSYTYGLSIINSHFFVGASIILTEKTLMQKEFWQQIKEYEATSFGGVPYTYEMLDKLRFIRMELPSLRTMTQAGGKLSSELHKKFAEYAVMKSKHFVVMYGQTEATARMSYLPYQKSLEKCGSMGIAIPNGRFELIDSDGQVISEPNVTGELVYYGRNVTLGYAQCGDDLILGDERCGMLVTGDMAMRDSDGYYYIVGRKKRFLKIFGSRVNLDEMERIVKSGFENIDCACAGTDDKMCIFITDESLTNDVRQFVSEKTGLNHTAITVKYIASVPKSEAGKTLYAKLDNL